MIGLGQLVDAAAKLGAPEPTPVDERDRVVRAVVHSTADVVPGALFCCVRGARVDGHDLAPAAVEAGAGALVVDHRLDVRDGSGRPVPQVVVADVRAAMGPLAAAFWGEPSRSLAVVGVTGTAGKTTVTQLVSSLLTAAGRPCDVIGTLSGARTTPEATELQAELARARAAGRDAVAMEVSSHGLDQHRVDGTRFAVAAFTNLSRDHLDYHRTMEEYFDAKARLFTSDLSERAVVCVDDDWGRRLADMLTGSSLPMVTYSLSDAEGLELSPSGARFTWRGLPTGIGLAGRFNVANALAAATVAEELGVPREAIAAGLRTAPAAPGRFEPVDAGQPFTVLVDYAHKPEALEQVLRAARDLVTDEGTGGRVLVVFGCGGDRDQGKRPVMGAVAGRLADQVVVTSDNPRSEDPDTIIAEVVGGLPAGARADVEPDRRRAIELAVQAARPGDVVLLAGKGHETTQTTGDRVVPFDDRVVAREALAAVGWSRPECNGDMTK